MFIGVVFLLYNSSFSHFSALRFVLQNTMSERQPKNTHPTKNNGIHKNEGKGFIRSTLKIKYASMQLEYQVKGVVT